MIDIRLFLNNGAVHSIHTIRLPEVPREGDQIRVLFDRNCTVTSSPIWVLEAEDCVYVEINAFIPGITWKEWAEIGKLWESE